MKRDHGHIANPVASSTQFTREMSLLDIGYASSGSRKRDKGQVIIQCVIEGQGVFAESELRAAIEQVAEATPACRMAIRGRWGFKRWQADGPLPSFRTLHRAWDGQHSDHLDFLDAPLDLFSGPVIDIIQVVSTNTYLVFRIHHAVMDGVAAMAFMQNIFRALRGEALENHHSVLTTEKLKQENQAAQKPAPLLEALNPLGKPETVQLPRQRERIWHRISMRGNEFLALPKVMLILSQAARRKSPGLVRMRMPISLRRHAADEKTSANLTGMIQLDIEEQDTIRTLVKKFNQKLAEHKELAYQNPSIAALLVKWVPFRLLQAIGRFIINVNFKRRLYYFSGTISSLGMIDLADYSTDKFAAQSVFGVPILPYTTPLFVSICGSNRSTEITLAVSKHLISDGNFTDLCNELRDRLNEEWR